MKDALTSLELHFVNQELQALKNAKLEKVYQPERSKFTFQLHVPGVGTRHLKVQLPGIVYISQDKSANPMRPSAFSMSLRKHLANARLRSITQMGGERILQLQLEKKDSTFMLYIELFSKGNIVLCDEHGRLINALFKRDWKDRSLRPGAEYDYPKKELNMFQITPGDLGRAFAQSDRNLVKFLAIELGLGGVYAEEICRRAKIEKTKIAITQSEADAVTGALEMLLHCAPEPQIIRSAKEILDVTPFPIVQYEDQIIEKFKDYSEALSAAYDVRALPASPAADKREKSEGIMKRQIGDITKLEQAIADNKQIAETIYQNYSLIETLLSEISRKIKTDQWQSFKSKLLESKKVVQLDEKSKQVVLQL